MINGYKTFAKEYNPNVICRENVPTEKRQGFIHAQTKAHLVS